MSPNLAALLEDWFVTYLVHIIFAVENLTDYVKSSYIEKILEIHVEYTPKSWLPKVTCMELLT